MPQTIKIKRSTNNQSPSSLAAGELAYSFKSGVDKLYIGSGDGSEVHAIGGKSYIDKLDDIEALADVTDTTNVVASLTAGTNVAIAANGTISATNTTYSVGDGGLTQNNFTNADHTKLNAIEALADITDATNVSAAGALMTSTLSNTAAVKAINQQLTTTSSPTFSTLKTTTGFEIKNAGADSGTGVGYADTSFYNNQGTLDIKSHTNLGIGGDVTTTMIQANASGVGIFTVPSSTYKLDVNGSGRFTSVSASTVDATNLKIKSVLPKITLVDITDGEKDLTIEAANGALAIKRHTDVDDSDDTVSGNATINLLNVTSSSLNAYTAAISAASIDVTGELGGASLDVSGNADIDGTLDVAGNVNLGAAAIAASGDDPAVDATVTRIRGDLQVDGVTTTVNSETVNIADNMIVLNSNITTEAATDGGIQVNRGTGTVANPRYSATIFWDEESLEWRVRQATTASNTILTDGNFTTQITTLDGGSFDT
jgi:hypothetical protein